MVDICIYIAHIIVKRILIIFIFFSADFCSHCLTEEFIKDNSSFITPAYNIAIDIRKEFAR